MGDGRWEMGDGRWEMGDGRWEMGDGGWGMGDGGWGVSVGGWGGCVMGYGMGMVWLMELGGGAHMTRTNDERNPASTFPNHARGGDLIVWRDGTVVE